MFNYIPQSPICMYSKIITIILSNILMYYFLSFQDNQGTFISLMMAYIFNAMTHLAIDVRVMAFKFVELVVLNYPSSFPLYAEKVCQWSSFTLVLHCVSLLFCMKYIHCFYYSNNGNFLHFLLLHDKGLINTFDVFVSPIQVLIIQLFLIFISVFNFFWTSFRSLCNINVHILF